MATNFDELKKHLLGLTAQQKAALARSLIEELDEMSDDDAERLWADEAQRRYAAFKAGEIAARSGDEVMHQARQRLK
jgi:hypothetical protein